MGVQASHDLADSPSADTSIYLWPVAAPTALGIYAYAAAIAMIGPWLAGWYGNQETPVFLAPFVVIFSGVTQFSAAIWAYRSRQTIITFISGMWSMEHLAWGVLFLLYGTGFLSSQEQLTTALGIWFTALALIHWMGAVAATTVSVATILTLVTGGVGASLAATGDLGNMPWLLVPAGYILTSSGFFGWYTASAVLLQGAFGRPVLPVGLTRRPPPVAPGQGEPGVRRGL
ncbi:MAG: GPR1/FUN34/YaaH family transporter [Chloroflexota bacterium]